MHFPADGLLEHYSALSASLSNDISHLLAPQKMKLNETICNHTAFSLWQLVLTTFVSGAAQSVFRVIFSFVPVGMCRVLRHKLRAWQVLCRIKAAFTVVQWKEDRMRTVTSGSPAAAVSAEPHNHSGIFVVSVIALFPSFCSPATLLPVSFLCVCTMSRSELATWEH